MTEIKILIVEDEILIAEDLKDKLLSFGCTRIEMAHNKTDAIKTIQAFNPDLILLDVRMENERDGIEIGEYITKNFRIPFIYITAHSDVNLISDILKTSPAGYLTKPLKKSDLSAAIKKAFQRLQTTATITLKLNDGYTMVEINPDTIRYIESDGSNISVHTDEQTFHARQSLDSVNLGLNPKLFFRIHHSYLINVSRVADFSKSEVVIDTGVVLPVSPGLCDEFEKLLRGKNKPGRSGRI